jgi:hypothetical protein
MTEKKEAKGLKYLFTAEYSDGSTFEQDSADVSIQDPKRSAFFDVLQEKLARFSLKGAGHSFLVDLRDGHFEIDGTVFWMHDKEISNIRLIYFRRHRHNFAKDRKTGAVSEESHTITYRIGWQANLADGSNVQEIMEIV